MDDSCSKFREYYERDINSGMSQSQALEAAAHRATIARGSVKSDALSRELLEIKQTYNNNETKEKEIMESSFKSSVGFDFITTDVRNSTNESEKKVEVGFRISTDPNRPDVLEVSVASDVYTQKFRMTKAYVERLLDHLNLMHKVMNHDDFC